MAAPPSTSRRAKRPPGLEDEEDEILLPPLDTDDGDDEPRPDLSMDELVNPDDDLGGDPFEDTNATDLEIGDEIDADDDSVGGDEPAEGHIDVGPLDEDIVDIEDGSDAEEGVTQGDDDDDLDDRFADHDDGGAEGTGEAIEDEVDDENLPELDSDDEGDFEDESLMREPLAADADPLLPPWDTTRWEPRAGAGSPVPCRAVAVGRGRVAAAGDVVLFVDEGAHAARRACAGGSAVVIGDTGVLVVSARGALLAWPEPADDSAATPVTSWRARRGAYELRTTPGRLWIRCDEALWRLPAATATDDRLPAQSSLVATRERGVAAIASRGGVLMALTVSSAGAAIETLGGDDEDCPCVMLGGDALRVALGESVRLAVAGRSVCLADPLQGLAISRDAGRTFQAVPLTGAVAVTFAGDGDDAPLLVLLDTDEGALVAILEPGGEPRLVAQIAGTAAADEPDDLGPADIAWDPARDVCWVACRTGLVALGRTQRH